jgi:hypothetical protein
MKTRYVVLVYGETELAYRQAWLLFVSLAAYADPSSEFIALTDHPERFEWFGGTVQAERLSADQLRRWRRGDHGWRHKLEAERALVPPAGALVLLDSDIVAVQPLAPFSDELHGGAVFLHKPEYVIGQSRRPGNRRMWESLRGRSFGGWRVLPAEAMWNAGVVALRSEDAFLINDALVMHDAIASAGADHPFLEQLTTSVVFGRTKRLRPASPYFAHYWGNKAGWDVEIRTRMARAREWTLAQAAEDYRQNPINLPLEVRPSRLQKIRRWFRRRPTDASG